LPSRSLDSASASAFFTHDGVRVGEQPRERREQLRVFTVRRQRANLQRADLHRHRHQ
jgi:hypothetical protein